MLENSFVFHISTLKAGNYFEKEQKFKKKKKGGNYQKFFKGRGITVFSLYSYSIKKVGVYKENDLLGSRKGNVNSPQKIYSFTEQLYPLVYCE